MKMKNPNLELYISRINSIYESSLQDLLQRNRYLSISRCRPWFSTMSINDVTRQVIT